MLSALALTVGLQISPNHYWEEMFSASSQAAQKAKEVHFTVMPVNGIISSDYGLRHHPLRDEVRVHHGIDIAAEEGKPFIAIASGTVIVAKEKGTLGNYIELSHHDKLVTRYAHAKEIRVRVGQRVRQGQIIGTVGKTGLATGPHLHFEVLHEGKRISPLAYIEDAKLKYEEDTYYAAVRFQPNPHRYIGREGHHHSPPVIDLSHKENAQGSVQKQVQATVQTVKSEQKEIMTSKTLWSIALDITRELQEANVYQGMYAIYQVNPGAFIGGNLNHRRADMPITLPEPDFIIRMDRTKSIEKYVTDLRT